MKPVKTDLVMGVTAMTDGEFAARVADFLFANGDLSLADDTLAAEFEVSRETVRQWARGLHVPEHNTQDAVVKWLEGQAS